MDDLREACTNVGLILSSFAVDAGITPYGKERLNDLAVALGELHVGRHSALFVPAAVGHSKALAQTDLVHQAIAHVCVELYRGAGVAATEARALVARLFSAKGIRNFSEAKLRAIGTRLTGAGSSDDPAYEYLLLVRHEAAVEVERRGASFPPSREMTSIVARALVGKARRRDHRLDAA